MPLNVMSSETITKKMNDATRNIELRAGYGYAIIPQNFVIVNEEEAIFSKYGHVFEGRNTDEYNVPRFVMFNDHYDLDDDEYNAFVEYVHHYNTNCEYAYEHIYDIKDERWPEGFDPGVWHLPVLDSIDCYYEHRDNPPYGCCIMRPPGYDYTVEDGGKKLPPGVPQRKHNM